MSNYLKKSAYSLEQAAKIIGCDETDLIDLAADREARIHVLTGGRTHFFTLYFNVDDVLLREMKQLPEICMVPYEHWKRIRAGQNPELNTLTDKDSKNSIDGIGDIPYLGPWYDLADREIKLTQFIVLHDELERLLTVISQEDGAGKHAGKGTKNNMNKKTRRPRIDNLKRAIGSALEAIGKKPSLEELWKYIQDGKDTTGIIEDTTDEKITWKDTKGKWHDISKNTLANRLSRVKS